MVERLKNLCDCGFPPAVYRIPQWAKEILPYRYPAAAEIMCGRGWFAGFKERHPHLVTRWSSQIDMVRALHCGDVESLTKYFLLLNDIIEKYNIMPCNIYNMDECGFLMGFAAKEKVLISRPRKNGNLQKQPGSREFATVIAAFQLTRRLLHQPSSLPEQAFPLQ